MTTGTGGRRQGGGRRDNQPRVQEEHSAIEKVVHIRRVAKVIKGGKHFRFNAVTVVGDDNGKVGIGYGKGAEVPDAVRKANLSARKHMFLVPLRGRTVPQMAIAKFGASQVLIKPAAPGTGIIAGGSVRAVLEAAGVRDVLTKSLGSPNPINVVKATFIALQSMHDPKKEVALRRARAEEAAKLPPPPPPRVPMPPQAQRPRPPREAEHGQA